MAIAGGWFVEPAGSQVSPRLIGRLVRLGEQVDRLSRSVRAGSRRFAEIASTAIMEARIPQLPLNELLYDCLVAGIYPAQRRTDEGFGQPSVTIFRNGRFTLDLLFWQTATTGIHQHQFGGAFCLLHGSSLHTKFAFQRRKQLGDSLILGSLSVVSVEILRVGDVRSIYLGAGLIHSLFHLDAPSVTLAIRSLPAARAGPEYEYIPPNLAVDPLARDSTKTIHKRLLTVSMRFCSDNMERYVRSLLISSDIHGAFLLLGQARSELEASGSYKRMVAVARRKHGADIDELLPAIEEQWRRSLIAALRATVVNSDHRLFIALLLNLPDLASVCSALSSLDPSTDPVQRIVRTVREFSSQSWFGLAFDDTHERVLCGMLEHLPKRRIARIVAENTLSGERDDQAVGKAFAALLASPFLEPLFR